MKKIMFLMLMMGASCTAFAEHIFRVCYINKTTGSVPYLNDGISRKWKSRGELVGSGDLAPGEKKCFGNIKDETVFATDMITFTLNHKWFGIMNPGFSRPYVIAQDATEKKGGKLNDNTDDGRDNYKLYIFVMQDGSFVLSTNKDINDETSIIKARKFPT